MKRPVLSIFFLLTVLSMRAQDTLMRTTSVLPEIETRLTGILGAFPPELVLLLQQTTEKVDTVINDYHFYKGVLKGKQVVIAQTGIGKVNAAVITTLMVNIFHPTEIIFTGIAGGVNPALAPGDIIVAEKLAYHDYGTITPDGIQIRPTKHPVTMEENPLYFSCDEKLVNLGLTLSTSLALDSIRRGKGKTRPVIKRGIVVTGDVFVSSSSATKKLWSRLHADATEMEGAAVAQVCWQQKIPFLIIRSLSDNAGNKAYTDMNSFYETAAKNSATLVLAMLNQLK